MRPQLFGTGILLALLGGLFYVLALPLIIAWSIPLVIGGAVLSVVSLLVAPSPGPVGAPEGFRYCVFCTNLMPEGAERCEKCNGVQPKA